MAHVFVKQRLPRLAVLAKSNEKEYDKPNGNWLYAIINVSIKRGRVIDRGRNGFQHHSEVHLRYPLPDICKDPGTTISATI